MSVFIFFYIIVLLFSVIVHEVAHGYVAKSLGDDTAEMAGRLTFNPLPHIDLFGSVLLPGLLLLAGLPVIAWAKPVPYNPNKLYKDYKYGPLKVGLAGPASNLLLLVVFALIARVATPYASPVTIGLLGAIAYLNCYLALFNLLPIPPLDGSKILPLLLPARYSYYIERMGFAGIIFVLAFIWLFSGAIIFVADHVFALIAGQQVFALLQGAL